MSAPGSRAIGRTRDRRARRAIGIAARVGASALLVLLVLASATLAVAAADPTASPAGGGDVRTNPAAPGIVGDPLFAVFGVAAIALVAVGVTLIAARLADRR